MKDFLLNNLDIFVTVIGFVVTYHMTTKSVGDEIRKNKIAHNVEKIHSLPLELCNMMSKIQKSSSNSKKPAIRQQDYEDLMIKIFAYGSRDAVTLATEIQQMFYKVAKTDEDCGQELLVLFSLLITQLKYDISDEIISPESWFRLKINDYENVRDDMVVKINNWISRLSLNEKFYVEK